MKSVVKYDALMRPLQPQLGWDGKPFHYLTVDEVEQRKAMEEERNRQYDAYVERRAMLDNKAREYASGFSASASFEYVLVFLGWIACAVVALASVLASFISPTLGLAGFLLAFLIGAGSAKSKDDADHNSRIAALLRLRAEYRDDGDILKIDSLIADENRKYAN